MKELFTALVAAQKAFPSIARTKTGQAGPRKYKYADLSDVLEAVRPALHDNGLMVTQGVRAGCLYTRIVHASGQYMEDDGLPLPANPDPQKVGSAITYMRRYSLCAALGIVADDDDDGAAAKEKPKQDNTPAPVPAAPDPVAEARKAYARLKDQIGQVATVRALDTLMTGAAKTLEDMPEVGRNELMDLASKRRDEMEKAA